MKYLPLNEKEKDALVKEIGFQNIDEMFRSIPEPMRVKTSDRLEAPASEIALRDYFHNLLSTSPVRHSFMGGNGHTHYIPSVIDPIVSRGEFLTAYTPYQPEVSQGTLQAMFEYQSMMADLMGVDVSNASLYDGSTAVAEACLMAARINRKSHMIVSSSVNPETIETLSTYCRGDVMSYSLVDSEETGKVELEKLSEALQKHGDSVSAVVIQSPNYYGLIENIKNIKDFVASKKILLIVAVTEAMSLAYIRSPGSQGADIVCGEAQSFGIPLSGGGPWLGFIGTTRDYVRNLPGRLVGETVDQNNHTSYVVTLAAREQHIRREKATSNICTNQGLMTLRSTMYLSVMGKQGLRRAAERSARFAEYGRKLIRAINGFQILHDGSSMFNEFILETPAGAAEIFETMVEKTGIAPGSVAGENRLIVAFNETMSPELIDRWAEELRLFARD